LLAKVPNQEDELGDFDLVRRIASRDEAALAAAYDRHSAVVYALLRRILRDDAAAEDILQEVFYQLWLMAARFDPERGSLRGWLMVMARNRAISLLRQQPRMDSEEVETQLVSSGILQDTTAAQNQLVSRIRGMMAQLPAEQRQTFELVYFEGMTHREIAERTGQPMGTVKTRLRAALGFLRRAFQT
jgi:RNA polymerase sigma-70 factor, ECF subfamily